MRQHADICLILEGTYPFVSGGVSNWAHDLICEQNHLNFHLLAIVPKDEELELKYKLPANVVSLKTVHLTDLPDGDFGNAINCRDLHKKLSGPLSRLTDKAPIELKQLEDIVNALRSTSVKLGSESLLDREEAWQSMIDLYESRYEEQSFLDFFWSYRAIAGGIYSVLLAELPSADAYHALSTGYAGLMAARAKIETGRPVMVTEHGIYTNERRIEVVSADWLEETASKALTIDKPRRDLRDMWIDSINNLSRVCYEASDDIITLFKGNQSHQLADGADPKKLRIIPNGVDLTRFGGIERHSSERPTIALIGRVVPIKDVKSYLRAISMLSQHIPDIHAYVIGPADEDSDYYQECVNMVELLGIGDNVTFTGRVKVDEYLAQIDLLVLTSISEAQPLVMLEAGACGIPLVATDVGACRELIEGVEGEEVQGDGGFVVPLSNPAATAEKIYKLLNDRELYQQCSQIIKARVERYYNLDVHQNTYRDLYAQYLGR